MNSARRAFDAYIEAWNRRDPRAILATFAPGGTFVDPMSPGVVSGDGIVAHAQSLLTAFPDTTFELVSALEGDDDMLSAQWMLRGTNTGSIRGLPPTGKAIAVPGADFVTAGPDGIQSIVGYFDQQTLMKQLGLKVMIRPERLGPFTFGDSTHLDLGRRDAPGAFSITFIEVSDAEIPKLRDIGLAIMQQMAKLPGVLSSKTMSRGNRIFTVTAWADLEAPKQLFEAGPHREAMQAFFTGGFSRGGWTSVWAPARIGALWARCESCQQMIKSDDGNGTCACGAAMPALSAGYW